MEIWFEVKEKSWKSIGMNPDYIFPFFNECAPCGDFTFYLQKKKRIAPFSSRDSRKAVPIFWDPEQGQASAPRCKRRHFSFFCKVITQKKKGLRDEP